ncbi:MAG: DEAD/DEAH box helicase family protein, partial [Elusimicrobia bacterium]|nr:DEAD/DEAH box helicase family protein [Elusimicrobiota bacterium]
MQLKDYQEKAMKELLAKSKSLLGYTGSKRLVFKAPTGSGKTIMVAEFLKLLVDDKEIKQQFSFIWTAPRQLHSQSKNKLDDYYQGNKTLKCSFFEDLDDIEIDENEILFFNWESINKSDNIYIRENEKDNNLTNVIKNTKEEDRQIILIIDECHHHATSDISKKLITDIEPKLTIEVSATPIVENPDESVTVQLEDVKKEGMIKKAVILNAEFENILKDKKIQSKLSQGTEEFVIDIALKKRTVLLNNFEKEKHGLVPINPLVLIQLPDRKTNLEDVIKEKVIRHLKKNGITTDNEKLAIWLSGEHVNKEDVERIDSDVEVLIFKQAIALGWDCPRAQILVLFRDWKSMVFSIQTIGRIMRMPEPDYGHYNSENLNYGYVYTNLEDIEVQEDIAKDYISIHSSIRNSNYKAIDLLSCHSKRQREKTRLSPLFINIFLKETEKYNLKQKIDIKSKKETQRIISDWAEENIDNLPKTVISGDKTIKSTNYELQKTFEYF